jgi:hypothetical protein
MSTNKIIEMKILKIISDYRSRAKESPDSCLLDCAREKDFLRTIEMAGMSHDGKNRRHSHQYRIPSDVLRKFTRRLLGLSEDLAAAETFIVLYGTVKSARVKGIGELTLYDTSQRIGIYLRIRPDKVFIHSGTRIGAQRYLGRSISERFLDKSLFTDFQHLTCGEIEDIMCIYKDDFLSGRSTGKRQSRLC